MGKKPTVTEVATTEPTVTTPTVTGVTASDATLGGNVTSDGGDTVTERGTVWALTPDPDIAGGNKTTAARRPSRDTPRTDRQC